MKIMFVFQNLFKKNSKQHSRFLCSDNVQLCFQCNGHTYFNVRSHSVSASRSDRRHFVTYLIALFATSATIQNNEKKEEKKKTQ